MARHRRSLCRGGQRRLQSGFDIPVMWAWVALSGCGARSSIDELGDAYADQMPTLGEPSVTPAAPTSVVSETDQGPLLLPAPCADADAAPSLWLLLGAPPPQDEPRSGQCGNGRVEEAESCDDSNQADGDGCSRQCDISPYYVCSPPGGLCTRLNICSDGFVSHGETCDDANLVSGDGCSPSCQLESSGAPTDDDRQTCGDGVVQAALGEQCDLGSDNTGSYGGCTALCILAARCGDAYTQSCGNETCDDGNRIGGDGCTADCQREQQWVR